MPRDADRPFKQACTGWGDVVLVCRKCSKKVDGGFGKKGRKSLAKALRAALGGGDRKDRKAALAVVEVSCFDVCPKAAVVALNAARPSELVIVQVGTPVDAVVQRLGLGGRPPEPRGNGPESEDFGP
jgi:predicted metal-binding protein